MFIFRCVYLVDQKKEAWCLIDHRQWHLRYDNFENKRFDANKIIPKISEESTIAMNLISSNACKFFVIKNFVLTSSSDV